MKKALNIFLIVLFNLSLVWVTVGAISLSVATSRSFYKKQFTENGIYAQHDAEGNETRKIIYFIGGDSTKRATFTDRQIDQIIDHIAGYMSFSVESFELCLDNVYIIDEGYCDGTLIFGEDAIAHMEDVRDLVYAVRISLCVTVALLAFLSVYFILKRAEFKNILFRYSRLFYLSVLFLALGFVVWSALGVNEDTPFALSIWKNMHYLLFPFQPAKIRGSALADALVFFLDTDFFISATLTVLFPLLLVIFLWLFAAFFIQKQAKKT